MMSGTIGIVLMLAFCLPGARGINTYEGADGLERFETPLQCEIKTLYDMFYYKVARSTYSIRNNQDCCYLETSRNKCCIEEITLDDGSEIQQCKCDRDIMCGSERNTEPSTTTISATSSTTAPSTTAEITTPMSTTTAASTSTPTTSTTDPTTSASPTESTTPVISTTTIITSTTSTTPSTTAPPTSTMPSTETSAPVTSTSSSVPTTTLSTALPTTTAAFRSLCSTSRVLNGDPVNNVCMYSNIAKVVSPSDSDNVVCNAVYARTSVHGKMKNTFITNWNCRELIENGFYDLLIGSSPLPLLDPLFNVTEGPGGTAFIDVREPYTNLLESSLECPEPACGYMSEFAGDIDYNDCRLVSNGAETTDTPRDYGQNEVSLYISFLGCNDLPQNPIETRALCFTSYSGQNVYCQGDSGAPVYCKAKSNGEFILIGVTAHQEQCDTTGNVRVLFVPT